MKTFKVKVIKSREECFWYNKHIGEVFEVRFFDEDEDECVIMNNEYPNESVYIDMAVIEMDDCKILEELVPSKFIEKHKI